MVRTIAGSTALILDLPQFAQAAARVTENHY
jgi:hypothetical protein